jgi:glycerol-3-phosphate acyltransferase PlsY
MLLPALVLMVGAYLLGSIASAILVSRLLRRPDPRTVGSGNPGATNVLRSGGKLAAALTLIGDLLKGLVPVAVGVAMELPPQWLGAVGLAAFLGHLYPVFFGFRGGKGVATGLGVLLGLDWQLGLAAVLTWLAVAAIGRYSSLAALVSFALAPVYTYALAGSVALTLAVSAIAALVFWRHRSNIRNLLAGSEGRIGQR